MVLKRVFIAEFIERNLRIFLLLMNLQHLFASSHVTVSFDSWNHWLYLEWTGELTLPVMQQACVELAHCFVGHAYPRVLNNNANVAHVEWDVIPWLVQHFFPHMCQVGIEQVAWVHGPTVRGRALADQSLHYLNTKLEVALFSDVEDAVSWLQQTCPEYASGGTLLPRSAVYDAHIVRTVQAFTQELVPTRTVVPEVRHTGQLLQQA